MSSIEGGRIRESKDLHEREVRFYSHDYRIDQMLPKFEKEIGASNIKYISLSYPFEIEPGIYIVGVKISHPIEGEIDQFNKLREKLLNYVKSSPLD